jgi:predicted PurR-regulated permease PerM
MTGRGIGTPDGDSVAEWQSPFLALRRAGIASWCALGVIALTLVLAAAVSAVSGILVPLVVAVIIGIVLEPIPEALKRVGVPPTLAAVLTLLAAVAASAGTIAIVVWGFLRQWSEIHRQLLLGWNSLLKWAVSLDVDMMWLDHARSTFEAHAAQLGQGILGAVTSTFYGALSLIMGTFFAVFFLFFTLRDANRFIAWLSHRTTLDADVVRTVISLSQQSVRGYFRGTAVTAIVTAPIFMVPLLLLGVPLALPIFILYFCLSFIPYVGAWITGAFAVLVAFGSGGPTAALILGVTFIMSNGTIQSVVSSWALGSSLQLHPVAVLLATMVGGTVAGLLGMVMGAPLLAAVAKSMTAVRRLRASKVGGGDARGFTRRAGTPPSP